MEIKIKIKMFQGKKIFINNLKPDGHTTDFYISGNFSDTSSINQNYFISIGRLAKEGI